MPDPCQVELVRGFNRFYTRQIGVLREGLLDTPFSLTEARVLYELGQGVPLRSVDLAGRLGLDAGFLSRLVHGFERRQLIKRAASRDDKRVSFLSLTSKGRAEFQKLNARSQAEVADMLDSMPSAQRRHLVDSMTSIRELLEPRPQENRASVTLRTHRPGDIGWVVARHGEVYAQQYGWDSTFEGLVAKIAGEFLINFDHRRERCWIAELNGERAGSVFLVKHSKTIAKLRLLLVEPAARGRGIGESLVDECIRFARESGYRELTLWTNDILHAARKIYERTGFRLTKQERHHSFGHDLIGQHWSLTL